MPKVVGVAAHIFESITHTQILWKLFQLVVVQIEAYECMKVMSKVAG